MPTPRQYATRADRQRAYRQRQSQARTDEQAAKGLPPLPAIPTMPGKARWEAMRDQAATLLETIRDEMQAYHDDRTEQWQESEKGEEFTTKMEAVTELAEAANQLELA